jgi:hypothetical protein
MAREIGVSEHYVRGTLLALRGGTLTRAQRIEQLWRLWEAEGDQRLAFADVARLVGVREGGCGRCWGRCAPPTATPPLPPIGKSGRWWSRTTAGVAGPGRLPRPPDDPRPALPLRGMLGQHAGRPAEAVSSRPGSAHARSGTQGGRGRRRRRLRGRAARRRRRPGSPGSVPWQAPSWPLRGRFRPSGTCERR